MLDDLTRINILNRVRNGEISAEQGLGLIKEAMAAAPGGNVYYTAAWQVQASASRDFHGNNILLFAAGDYNALELKTALETEAGCRVMLILPGEKFLQEKEDLFTINPYASDDYALLFKKLQEQGWDCSHLIHYWSTLPFNAEAAGVQKQLEMGIYSIFRITRALMEQKIKHEIDLLYCYVNTDEVQHPLYAAACGFNRTLQWENPRYRYKTVGIHNRVKPGPYLAGILVQELGSAAGAAEIYYTGEQRYVRCFVEADAPGMNPISLKPGGTYLVAGGAGGLGLIFAAYIAGRVQANLVLTNRSGLTPGKERAIASIRQTGTVVEYLQADISEPGECRELLLTIKKRFGKLDGIINSAGINRDSFIMKKTGQEWDKVLKPKVWGSLNLDLLTRGEALDFFILFSSITGAIGNTGQCDYAFANSFLDAYAFYREQLRAQGVCRGRTLAINWPLWEEGGMQVDAAARDLLRRAMGMEPLKTAVGLAAFAHMIRMDYAQVGIVAGDRDKILEKLGIPAKAVQDETQGVSVKMNQEEVQTQLLTVCSELLKVNSAEIDLDTELVEYGVGSIMMISLLNRIEKLYGDTIAPNAISDYPTIRLLADHLIGSGIATGKAEKEEPAGEVPFAKTEQVHTGTAVTAAVKPRFITQESSAYLVTGRDRSRQDNRVAIISMACRLPQSDSPADFWEHLKNGRDLIRETPPDRWDVGRLFDRDKKGAHTSYSKWAGYVDNIDLFDAAFFGIPDESALILDPQHRIILELSQELIDRAGYTKKDLDDSRTSVYIGANESAYIYRYWEQIPGAALKNVVVNRIQNMMAARVADFYNLRGPALTLDTACSSSLVAVHEACRAILEHEVEMAIVGGIDLLIGEYNHVGFSQSGALSREPKSYVFDERAGGFVLGEGAGLVLLKDYAKAVADGDPVLAVILGSAVNNDGHTMGLTVPDLEGQQDVIRAALRVSGIDPATITCYEAHGTGTLLGDPIEIKAATTVYREYTDKLKYCAVGSVKTNIGHLLRAAGIASLLKILLSIQHRTIPATLNCERPHPRFKFDTSPFYPNLAPQPWNPAGGIRRAAISSFGFGGTNAHMILEEFDRQTQGYAQKREPRPVTRFNRKRYWIGKPVEAADNSGSAGRDLQALLEMLSRGEITVEQMMELEHKMQGD